MSQRTKNSKKSIRSGSRKNRLRTTVVPAKLLKAPYTIPDGWMYGDLLFSSAVTTTVSTTNITGAVGSVLASAPQCTRPVFQNGGIVWRAKVLVHAVSMILRAVGSESNTLIAADIYNFVRATIGQNSLSSNTVPTPILVSVDSNLNLLDFEKVLYDKRHQLLSQAFDASNYNVPGAWIDETVIPVNSIFNFDSAVPAGTSAWGANNSALWFNCVSDSTVAPSPTINASFRVWFSILDV